MFERRSDAREILDDFALEGEDVAGALRSIERVNRWLGGYRVLLDGLERALAEPKLARNGRALVVHDIGCGGGDGLRALARWSRASRRPLQLTGIDANPWVLDFARAASADHPEIRFEGQDVLAASYDPTGVDIVTLNLCLHHFTDEDIERLLSKCRRAGVGAVLINDLHRHWLAYGLFWLVCRLCCVPRIARVDGLLSVRKGFRREELGQLARRTGWSIATLRWRWAFRYQLTLLEP